jgi:hypothetical protein
MNDPVRPLMMKGPEPIHPTGPVLAVDHGECVASVVVVLSPTDKNAKMSGLGWEPIEIITAVGSGK